MDTPKELLAAFPQLGFNIDNHTTNERYDLFLKYINAKGFRLTDKNVRRLVRNFFKATFNITFPNVSKVSLKFWIARGYSENESRFKVKEFYDTTLKGKRVLPTQLQYYLNKGLSEKEAKLSLRKEQQQRVAKLIEKEVANPELRKRRLWNDIEYWLNKGYTEEQGQQLMNARYETMNYQTFKKLVQKYIDNGDDVITSTNKASEHYKNTSRKSMATRIKNKAFGFQKASKQSLIFFKPLMDFLDSSNIEYYVGTDTKNEWFLASGTEYFYSYDFYIPSKKLLIEYNGEHVHPNPSMSREEWLEWKHCWTKKSANECRESDLKKIRVAQSRGYKVVEVFESDAINSIDLL